MVKDGTPTVEIPAAAEFSDLHHQATSVVQAVSHSQLHSAAVADVGRATDAGRVDQAADDRVAAYEAPVETRASSEEFSKADLAASYATLNRTTAIPAVYVPPAQTQDPENVERWAKTMEVINANYFGRRIASQKMLQGACRCLTRMLPKEGDLDRQVSARRRSCRIATACACAHRRQGASLRSAPAPRG